MTRPVLWWHVLLAALVVEPMRAVLDYLDVFERLIERMR